MKTEIEKRASKFIDETDMMQFTTMEIMVMFAEKELENINNNHYYETLENNKPETFELWMESKGYRQNSEKQWLKHVYTMGPRTLNNFKLEYENL